MFIRAPRCIAGGCLFNWKLGKPAKDLDFLVTNATREDAYAIEKLGYKLRISEGYWGDDRLLCVAQTDVLGVPIDVCFSEIGLAPYVEDFPIRATRITQDVYGNIWECPLGVEDFEQKALVCSIEKMQDDYVQQYINRYRVKCPDWTVGYV